MIKSSLETIIIFLQNHKHDGSPIVLSQCETINDYKTFVESHISALKSNSGNKTFKPYYDRLLKLYNLLKNELR